VLGRHDRFDDVGDIVDVGEGFDAKQNVVEWLLGRMGGIFGCADDCARN
jgi:hypothetical protein